MSENVQSSVARMMKWRGLAMPPTVLLVSEAILFRTLFFMRIPLSDNLDAAMTLLGWLGVLWAVPLWLVLFGTIYWTGHKAFGPGAGLGYTIMAFVLTFFFGLGVFSIPLMVRSDIRLLLDEND